MKHANKLIAVLLLTLTLVACNSTAVQTVEVTRVVPQTVIVTEAVQQAAASIVGGFTIGVPVDVSILPALMKMPGGAEPVPCFTENTEPSISWGWNIYPYATLCLNNFPTVPDSPGFTITLTDPTGRTFSEPLAYNQGKIVNSMGAHIGFIQSGSSADATYPSTPGVSLEVFMPLPCGDWSISANTQDGSVNVGPTILTQECHYPQTSVAPDLDMNPIKYTHSRNNIFTNGETLHIVGTTYPPNTAITVALYQEDPSVGTAEGRYPLGTAKYAVSFMTDNAGNFQVPFLVGNETLRGAYWAVAASTITSELRLDPFGAQFSIEQ